jgi:hypothetical protein
MLPGNSKASMNFEPKSNWISQIKRGKF